MWRKTATTVFVVTVLLFSFNVKKTWAADANTKCCPEGLTYSSAYNNCWKAGETAPNNCGGEMKCKLAEGSNPAEGNFVCDPSTFTGKSSPFDPCKNLTLNPGGESPQLKCRNCTGIQEDGTFSGVCPSANGSKSCGTWTSIGCIPNDPPNLVGYILRFGSGIAGGIAFLLILFGSAQIVMSGGVPEKIAAGKEIITSAVIGLVFIFVSVLVLQIIGVKIIGIPGWL